MANYKKIILDNLLNKYETSKSRFSETNRRIILKVNSLKEYDIENYEAKKLFHDVVMELKRAKLIDFSWKKYEKREHIREYMDK